MHGVLELGGKGGWVDDPSPPSLHDRASMARSMSPGGTRLMMAGMNLLRIVSSKGASRSAVFGTVRVTKDHLWRTPWPKAANAARGWVRANSARTSTSRHHSSTLPGTFAVCGTVRVTKDHLWRTPWPKAANAACGWVRANSARTSTSRHHSSTLPGTYRKIP